MMGSISRSLNRQEAFVDDRCHIATLDLHLVTAAAVCLVHTEDDAWHVVPTDSRRENHVGSIVAGKSSIGTCRCHAVLQCLGSCGARPPVPCRRTHSSQRPQRLPNHFLNSGMSMSSSSINFRRLLCASSRTLLSFWSMVLGISGIAVNRRTHGARCIVTSKSIFAHCHFWRWHKPTKQVTSQLKFEPHLDRQCLIVFDSITFVLDQWKLFNWTRHGLGWGHPLVSRARGDNSTPVMVRILVYCSSLSPRRCVRIK